MENILEPTDEEKWAKFIEPKTLFEKRHGIILIHILATKQREAIGKENCDLTKRKSTSHKTV